MSYLIHQFHLSNEASDHLNSVGWDGDFGDFPEIVIQRDVKFMGGSKNYEPWMETHFASVASCNGVLITLKMCFMSVTVTVLKGLAFRSSLECIRFLLVILSSTRSVALLGWLTVRVGLTLILVKAF